jgi:hypothetical protein
MAKGSFSSKVKSVDSASKIKFNASFTHSVAMAIFSWLPLRSMRLTIRSNMAAPTTAIVLLRHSDPPKARYVCIKESSTSAYVKSLREVVCPRKNSSETRLPISRNVGPFVANSQSTILILDWRSALSKFRSAFAGLAFMKNISLGLLGGFPAGRRITYLTSARMTVSRC